jgi:hypothetical protein
LAAAVDLMPTAHQNGSRSENLMLSKPAATSIRSISRRVNRFSKRVLKRS